MKKILVAYATMPGSTAEVAQPVHYPHKFRRFFARLADQLQINFFGG